MENNISQRRSSEDASSTATSMYLSFDAESTMSTACYKTLEAMTDLSTLSTIEDDASAEDKHLNSTLENNQDSSQILSPLKTVKKMEIMTTNSPLRVLPKNILREYKALCSTPSKEQLLKSVDVTRGSDARCVDLGVAFLGVDDEQPAFFPPPSVQQLRQQRYEENKENALPESGDDGSTLSVSSSVEIVTSVIEKKRLNSVSTAGSLTGEESMEEIKILDIEEDVIVEGNIEKIPIVKISHMESSDVHIKEAISNASAMDGVDATPKAKFGNLDKIETIKEELPEEMTPKVHAVEDAKKAPSNTKFAGRPKIAVLTARNTRRSMCEPNLQTNKPSRISTAGVKRQSLLPITRKAPAAIDVETEIPMLMNKLLKISNTSAMEDKVDNKPNKMETIPNIKQSQPTDKRRSAIGSTKGRSSLMPPSLGEKRPFSFTQRMSVIVKTTLNSPARKMARKSVMGTSSNLALQQQRRSIMASRFAPTSRTNKFETGVRKSMIPNSKSGPLTNGSKTNTKTLTNLKETTTQQKKSLYFPAKGVEETKIKPSQPTGCDSITRLKIQETTFTCNSCKEKFRVKSLLDAHRRSHEGDIETPTLIRKPATSSASSAFGSGSNPNQCKYCDKKFALLRALHIHLLEKCLKIPPSEKRKLQFTEMNHVEKARLPNVFQHGHGLNSAASSTQATPRVLVKHNVLTQKSVDVSKGLTEFGNGIMEKDLRNKSCDSSTTSSANGSNSSTHVTATGGGSGSVQKPKKASAHSGVYRTPSKTVPCHVCKLTFKSILDYTNHSLAMHGYKAQKDDVSSTGDGMEMQT